MEPLLQYGNLKSLLQVSIAFNTAYSLFQQVQSFGQRHVHETIEKKLVEWEASAEDKTNKKENIERSRNAVKQDLAAYKKQAVVVTKWLTKGTTIATLLSFLLLLFCSICGGRQCEIFSTMFYALLVSILLLCAAMPFSILSMKIFWFKKERDITKTIKHHREFCAGKTDIVVKKLEKTT